MTTFQRQLEVCSCPHIDVVVDIFAGVCRYGMVGATVITIAGLTKLNVFGPGMTETIKYLWRTPKKQKTKA